MINKFRSWLRNWLMHDDNDMSLSVLLDGRWIKLTATGTCGENLICRGSYVANGVTCWIAKVVCPEDAVDGEIFNRLHRKFSDASPKWEDETSPEIDVTH